MNREDYEQYRDELLKQKYRPYIFSNEELADDFFTMFKEEYPKATYYKGLGEQIICYSHGAEVSLKEMLDKHIEETKKKLDALQHFRDDVSCGFDADFKREYPGVDNLGGVRATKGGQNV